MLPAAASLKKQGANKGAVTAFLISTPESGVDSIAVTYALLDPIMTIIRPVAAFITALFAGVIENTISYRQPIDSARPDNSCPLDNCCDGEDCPPQQHKNHHTRLEKVSAGIRFALVDVWGDIVLWFFAGLVIAGAITALIPEDLMVRWLGGGFVSMLLMLAFGIPLYICATASTPIAAALILKGVSPGVALVFLLVGPATNITSLTVLVRLLGKWSVVRYLTALATMAILFGFGVDYVYLFAGIVPQAVIGEAAELVPPELKLAATVLLMVFSVKPFMDFFKKILPGKRKSVTFHSGFPEITKSTKSSVANISSAMNVKKETM